MTKLLGMILMLYYSLVESEVLDFKQVYYLTPFAMK